MEPTGTQEKAAMSFKELREHMQSLERLQWESTRRYHPISASVSATEQPSGFFFKETPRSNRLPVYLVSRTTVERHGGLPTEKPRS